LRKHHRLAQGHECLLPDLSDGKSRFFLAGRPSSAALEEFLAALQVARERYLRERYLPIDPTSSPHVELRAARARIHHMEQELEGAKTRLVQSADESRETDRSRPDEGTSKPPTLN
jgi:hypothetical protein